MSEKTKLRELSYPEREKLLSLVDKPDSDFDDNEEVMGWVNYSIDKNKLGLQILTVTFESSETGETHTGRWVLRPIDSKLEVEA